MANNTAPAGFSEHAMINPILRRYWPPEGQILLLKVALADRENAQQAWNEWSAHNNLNDASWAEARLLASAARRVREFDSASPLLKRLEGIRRHIWTTTQLNINSARPLLMGFCEAGVRLMLIKGAACLALNPESSADRYLTDIDVLVHPEDWPTALDLANRHGWRCPLWPTLAPDIFPYHHAVAIQDGSGSTIDLHHLALFMCRNVGDDEGLWQRARTTSLRGCKLFAPSPADEVLLSIAHGLLHALSPVCDWMLDIAPPLQAGAVDWAILEDETGARNIEPNIASGLLFAVEQFGLPVPKATLDRIISRVREPFITDFRSFATCHMPNDPWMIERVKAAAALRALSASRRTNKLHSMTVSPHQTRSMAAQTNPDFATASEYISPRQRLPSKILRRLQRRLSRARLDRSRRQNKYVQMAPGEKPISVSPPPNLSAEALVTLKILLDVEPHAGPHRPILEITAPGLILKRWRAPDVAGSHAVFIQMPAALLAMRRIRHLEFRAVESNLAVPFKNVRLEWSIIDDPSGLHPRLSNFFDPVWYQRKQPDASVSATESLWDYLEAGWLDGRNPSPQFDANKYLRLYHDVANARINPLLHYLRSGMTEGRFIYPVSPTEMPLANGDAFADEYSTVSKSGFFDEAFYCLRYPETLISDLAPMDEFVRGGWRGRRSPGPQFDTDWYTQMYPEVVAADLNPLVHFLRYGRAEGRHPMGLSERVKKGISAALPGLTRLEPQLEAFAALRNPDLLAGRNLCESGGLQRAFGAFFKSLDKAYDRIIFLPWMTLGGADLVATLVAKAAADLYGQGSVLILITDSVLVDAAHWLPSGLDVRTIADLDSQLNSDSRAHFVAAAIGAIRPKAVMNINSNACWNAYKKYGNALANKTDLYAMLFGRDYDAAGVPIGYSDTHFRDCSRYLQRIYCDTERFPGELTATYGLTLAARAKLTCIRPPPEGAVTAWVRRPSGRQQRLSVLWAGRWSREKNIELLLKICRSAPDMEFHIFGTGSDHYARLLMQAQTELNNIIVEGKYASFGKLPISRHDVFLYTSSWDGMPRVLVSAAASGMPVVAPDVGGISELIDAETGWLVNDSNNVLSYVKALREIRAGPAEVDKRRKRLMERIAKEHNWKQFLAGLALEPGFLAK